MPALRCRRPLDINAPKAANLDRAAPAFCRIETHELGEEIVASYLYQTFLYDWLERSGHGRFLMDDDL